MSEEKPISEKFENKCPCRPQKNTHEPNHPPSLPPPPKKKVLLFTSRKHSFNVSLKSSLNYTCQNLTNQSNTTQNFKPLKYTKIMTLKPKRILHTSLSHLNAPHPSPSPNTRPIGTKKSSRFCIFLLRVEILQLGWAKIVPRNLILSSLGLGFAG